MSERSTIPGRLSSREGHVPMNQIKPSERFISMSVFNLNQFV